MREILYRALSMCRGEHWVYGQPRHYARNPHTEKWTIYDPATGIETDIVEETLGQYTGLTDKNDNKIFEGDIINITTYENLAINAGFKHNEVLQLSYNDCRGRLLGQWYSEVVYKECAFLVGDDFLCAFADDPRITYPYFELCVCGNIHDNPDMSKGRTQIGKIPLDTIVMKGAIK